MKPVSTRPQILLPWAALAVAGLIAMLSLPAARAESLSPLGEWPDWKALDAFQNTITHDEFLRLLTTVYAPHGGWEPYIRVDAEAATIRTSNVPLLDLYTLHFRDTPASDLAYLRAMLQPTQFDLFEHFIDPEPPAAAQLAWQTKLWLLKHGLHTPPASLEQRPLERMRILLDPGHLGGRWAKMEERSFVVGDAPPVQEGDLTLRTAARLQQELERLGAEVRLARSSDEPATTLRPPDLEPLARQILLEMGARNPLLGYSGPGDPQKMMSVKWQSEALFTRAEIRARIKATAPSWPDLTVCLHYNAERWGDETRPTLVPQNHLHVLINGGYQADEIALDDVRFEMLRKLLDGSHAIELPAAEAVAVSLAAATGLPPFEYKGANAVRAGTTGYVWARNLLASRLYRSPTIYLEPYVMNSPEVVERVQAGDYEGTRLVAGAERKSIYREYAEAVANGLAEYVRGGRTAP